MLTFEPSVLNLRSFRWLFFGAYFFAPFRIIKFAINSSSYKVRSAHFRHDQLQLKCIVEVEGPERPHAVHHSAIPGVIHPIDFQGHRPHGSQNGHGQRNVNNGHHQITPPLSVFDHNNLSQQYSANCATTMAWNLPFLYNSFVAVCVAMQAVLHLLLGSYV